MVALPPKNTLLFLRLLKQYLGLFWRERPRKKRLPATFLFFLVLWRQMRGKKVSFLLLPLLTSVETTRKASSFVATSDDDDDDDDGARERERERGGDAVAARTHTSTRHHTRKKAHSFLAVSGTRWATASIMLMLTTSSRCALLRRK